MSGNGYESRDSVQAPLTLITAFWHLARSSTFGRSAHGCGGGGRGWCAGLQDSQMVDDKARIGVAVDQRRARIYIAPAQYVDRKVALYGRTQDPVEARVIRLAFRILRHNDPDADRAGCLLPVGDDI